MKKEEAQSRLTAMEVEIKELRKIIQRSSDSKEITERVKTFEDACEICPPSDNVKTLLDYKGVDKDMLSHRAHAKLTIIARALNEGWTPDWSDASQEKWYPYFKMSPFGFSLTGYEFWNTYTLVGPRLCFKSEKLAKYAGKQFESTHEELLTL